LWRLKFNTNQKKNKSKGKKNWKSTEKKSRKSEKRDERRRKKKLKKYTLFFIGMFGFSEVHFDYQFVIAVLFLYNINKNLFV